MYKLNKALYGLKQAPRAWYSRIEAYFLNVGFQKCPYEYALFTKFEDEGKMLIICLYVDDLIFTGNDSDMLENFKDSMMVEFDKSDLGKMQYFLGIEVVQSTDEIFICRFKMDKCNSASTPIEFGLKLTKYCEGKKIDSTHHKQIVGSLMYSTTTRPNIMYYVSLIQIHGESYRNASFSCQEDFTILAKNTRTWSLL